MGLHLPSLEEEAVLKYINNYNSIKNISLKAFIENNLNQTNKIGSLEKRTENILMFNNILSLKVNNNIFNNSHILALQS